MTSTLMALDVGEKRIGVALADTDVKLAYPLETVEVDGSERERLQKIITLHSIDTLVVGYPRNQSGEPTAQTTVVEQFATTIRDLVENLVFQDESLTSVHAESRLKSSKKPYTRGDIDKLAASIILQDYMEQHYG